MIRSACTVVGGSQTACCTVCVRFGWQSTEKVSPKDLHPYTLEFAQVALNCLETRVVLSRLCSCTASASGSICIWIHLLLVHYSIANLEAQFNTLKRIVRCLEALFLGVERSKLSSTAVVCSGACRKSGCRVLSAIRTLRLEIATELYLAVSTSISIQSSFSGRRCRAWQPHRRTLVYPDAVRAPYFVGVLHNVASPTLRP